MPEDNHVMTEFKRFVNKGSLEYHYMRVCLEFEDLPDEINVSQFKLILIQAMKTLFGEVGASIPVDVLKYSKATREALLRVPSSGFVKLWSSLTLYGSYNDMSCAFRVKQVSPHLMSMAVNSREFFS